MSATGDYRTTTAGQATLPEGVLPATDGFLYAGAALTILGVTLGQRLGWVIDASVNPPQQVPLCVFTTYIALGVFLLSGLARFDVTRLALYCLSVALMIAATLTQSGGFSTFSLAYIVILYTPFVFVVPVTERHYRTILELYQKCLVPVALIAIGQYAMQLAGMPRPDPIAEHLPRGLVLSGYNTYAFVAYEFQFRRSNGLFFLEPSFLSQFAALALIIEWLCFRRPWRLALYGIACFTSLSGTGLVLLAVVAGVLLIQQRKPWLVLVGIAAYAAMTFLSEYSEILRHFLGRTSEFGSEHSSASMRFIGPIVAIPDAMGNNLIDWLTGFGPGNSKQLHFYGYEITPFASSKLMLEYGLIGSLPFLLYITNCIVTRRFNAGIAVAMLLIYHVLSGSLLQPHTIFLVWILGCVFVPREKPASEAVASALMVEAAGSLPGRGPRAVPS
jgi:hypothetical protein